MRVALLALALLPSVAFAITITAPSASKYWVQFDGNQISWTTSSGDPSTVDIYVANSNTTLLNGNFSIARNVLVSSQSFLVTNVTLVVGSGYKALFTNSTDLTNVFATSSDFEVKLPGTSPAPTTAPSPTTAANGSSSGNSTGSPTSTSTTSRNAALGLVGDPLSLLYACGIVEFSTFYL